jgi:hypothetical protein
LNDEVIDYMFDDHCGDTDTDDFVLPTGNYYESMFASFPDRHLFSGLQYDQWSILWIVSSSLNSWRMLIIAGEYAVFNWASLRY